MVRSQLLGLWKPRAERHQAVAEEPEAGKAEEGSPGLVPGGCHHTERALALLLGTLVLTEG